MKIRRILFLALCVMIFSLLGNTKVSADEIVMNQESFTKTYFTITIPPEEAKNNPNYKGSITPEECEGNDEAFVRIDLTETTFLFLHVYCPGSMNYDIQDENGNAIYTNKIAGMKNCGYLVNAAFSGVLPEGTYYWHFYDYSDSDYADCCFRGKLDSYILVGDCVPCCEDDSPSRNDTLEDAISLEPGVEQEGYLGEYGSAADPADWYKIDVRGDYVTGIKMANDTTGIQFTIVDSSGNEVASSTIPESEFEEITLEQGIYYLKLSLFGSELTWGDIYRFSYTLTHNYPKAEGIQLRENYIIKRIGWEGANVEASLLPLASVDEIAWIVEDESEFYLSQTQEAGTAWCYIRSKKDNQDFEDGYIKKINVTAYVKDQPEIRKTCTVVFNKNPNTYVHTFYTIQIPYTGKPFSPEGYFDIDVTGSTGKVSLEYFSDEECTRRLDPDQVVEPGVYYFSVIVESDGYFNGTESIGHPFAIVNKGSVDDPDDDDIWDDKDDCGDETEDVQELTPISSVKVSGITLSGISRQIAAGKSLQLTAAVLPKNATNKKMKWISTNTKVATVTQNGKVTVAKNAGGKSVTIKAAATDGSGKQAIFTIKVMKGAVTKVTIKGARKTLKVGKTMKLKAVVKATKGANKKLKWISGNGKYATVSSTGKVKALKAGKGKKVKITAMATDGSGKKKTVTIKIK